MREVVKETTHYFQSEESSCGNENNAVERAKIYLENHIDQPLSAADVAAALFMNADYLSRLFKNECGITLKEYILKIKMESARNLLQTTALPVSVIASKLGYDNFPTFPRPIGELWGYLLRMNGKTELPFYYYA
ncbi:MAG: helix-turn-helix transcriptional regulator [Eisenbergiella massiliensis]